VSESAQRPPSGGSPKRILLVEDDVHTLRINSRALSAHGYEIHEAVDGEEAVRRAVELRPDLIVMDLGLPDTPGIEATRRIKEAVNPSPIIVVLSAHAMRKDLEAARAAGCDAFLAKPIDPFDLVHEIERRLGGTEAGE
jgi:two-component system, cell cycle response regulator DivK